MRLSCILTAKLSGAVQVLILTLGLLGMLYAKSEPELDGQSILASLEKSYGKRAQKRGKAWLKLMKSEGENTELEKLNKVNRFFNLFHFIDDIKLWGSENYWASPLEFIGVNGGDCEDFAIAKYFTLRELGIADEKMRITMVKAASIRKYHMVLAYYQTPGAVPLILDNLDGAVKTADKRKDLIPVYSFNASQLWLNKEKGKGLLSGKASRLTLWRDLRQRISAATLKQPKLKLEF